MQFTVCVLLYGDHPQLAERVLRSLSRNAWRDKFQLRIGRNNLSRESLQVARNFGTNTHSDTIYYDGEAPFYKYPLMRIMLHKPAITTPYTMWFDDDSWVAADAPDDWFEQIERHIVANDLHVIGAPYFLKLRGNQHQWIEDQPWYTGKPVGVNHRVNFITGGWLTLRTELVQKFDWPPPAILHNGGDVMLGALCAQQNLRMGKFTNAVCINADQTGVCSTAVRRGASLSPVGVDYKRLPQPTTTPPQAIEPIGPTEWLNLFDGRNL